MTLHETETKLAEINNSLAELLKEREKEKIITKISEKSYIGAIES